MKSSFKGWFEDFENHRKRVVCKNVKFDFEGQIHGNRLFGVDSDITHLDITSYI